MRNRATTPLSLNKTRIRQSWSKYNLYNLQRLRNPNTQTKSFFQQKFFSRTLARTYHGEQVPEGQWARMFSRRIRSVVPMDAIRMARDDGSQASAGRGSGLDLGRSGPRLRRTPFMQMTFAPLERRLDVAIFRALFASSTRQARQFVIHGAVTVNGQKMRYPGYLLNPGDLFQVDPERVMFATGAPKDKQERRAGRVARKKADKENEGEGEGSEESAAAEQKEEKPEAEAEVEGKEEDPRETLKGLMRQAKTIMSSDKESLPAKRKQELRGFQRAVQRVLSRSDSSAVLADNLESQFAQLTSLLKAKKASGEGKGKQQRPEPSTRESSNEVEEASSTAPAADDRPGEALTEAFKKASLSEGGLDAESASELTEEEFEVLKRALTQLRDNPIDHTKPYATPWRPRNFMSAFAFVPRYLEVNQNVCAAVYVRHPVARPGYTEVPSPFSEETGTHAFTWYLRRR